MGKAHDDAPALFCDVEIGQSRWLTLEAVLDAQTLARTGAAFAMIEAAAAPRIAAKAVLRTPRADAPEGFVDGDPVSFVLDSTLRKTPLAFAVGTQEPKPHEGYTDARMLIFLPLRQVSLCMRKITLAPVRA